MDAYSPSRAYPFILRGTSTLLMVLGAAVCPNTTFLVAAWFCLVLTAICVGINAIHAKLTITFILPIAVGSVLIHGLAHPSIPGDPGWVRFLQVAPKAISVAARLGVIAAACQICVLPLTTDGRLIPFLREWRLPYPAILVLSSTITLLAEVNVRIRQVLDARRAQGNKGRWGSFVQLPLVLMPLLVNVLDSAAARADLWYNRDLVTRLSRYRPITVHSSPQLAILSLLLSGGWCGAALWMRFA